MKIFSNLFFFLSFSAALLAQDSEKYVSEVWLGDNGDGTYTNPILFADYSDPDVVRVGEDYFMTASSFNVAPGLPILHSKDMVNWKLINHAVQKQIPEETFEVPQHGNGIWAPSMRYHNHEFYIYWGDPDHGIYMVKTDDPYGQWEEPVLVLEGKGLIDPSPLWDENDKAYLVHAYAGSRAGVNSLLTVRKMNPEGTRVLDEGKHVFDGHDEHPTVEGPKFYKRNGYYYIFAPAGGVATGWQLILRSKDIYGPYEEKVVLEQGRTQVNGPHQGAWVETPKGESWFYHFQEVDPYGRIIHLQPMSWKNNWPDMGEDQDGNGIGEPVKTHANPDIGQSFPVVTPVESDEFKADSLGLQWQWHANPDVVWHAKIPGTDHLRLFSITVPEDAKNLWMVPNLLLQKFPAPEFTATTKMSLEPQEASEGKRAGLIVMGTDYATLSLTHDENGFLLKQTKAIDAENGGEEKTIAQTRLEDNEVVLRVEVTGPEGLCRFSYSEDGEKFKKIGEPFRAQPGKWIGAKIGLFSISKQKTKRGGYADAEWFRITKLEPTGR